MSRKAAKSAKEAFDAATKGHVASGGSVKDFEAADAAAGDREPTGKKKIPVNHPGDNRTYKPGTKIVGNTLIEPETGIPSSTKAAEAFEAACAARDGQPYDTDTGVNLGKPQPVVQPEDKMDLDKAAVNKDYGLAASIREKGEQNVNSGSLLKPQDEDRSEPSKTLNIDEFLSGLTDEQKAEFERRFMRKVAVEGEAVAYVAANGSLRVVDKADMLVAPKLSNRMELRDKIEAEAVRHERCWEDFINGACQSDSPLTSDAIRQLRLTALGLADNPETPLDELALACKRLEDIKFDYPPKG